jgi:hypothetical protein
LKVIAMVEEVAVLELSPWSRARATIVVPAWGLSLSDFSTRPICWSADLASWRSM